MRQTLIHCDRCHRQVTSDEAVYQITAGIEVHAGLKSYDICAACLRAFGEFIGATTHVPFGEQVGI